MKINLHISRPKARRENVKKLRTYSAVTCVLDSLQELQESSGG